MVYDQYRNQLYAYYDLDRRTSPEGLTTAPMAIYYGSAARPNSLFVFEIEHPYSPPGGVGDRKYSLEDLEQLLYGFGEGEVITPGQPDRIYVLRTGFSTFKDL